VRRRLASESCVGVLLQNDSTRLRHAVTSRRVWGQTAKYVIDEHPRLCFATPLQSRIKTWLIETRLVSPMILIVSLDTGGDSGTDGKSMIDKHARLCFATPLQSCVKTWWIETKFIHLVEFDRIRSVAMCLDSKLARCLCAVKSMFLCTKNDGQKTKVWIGQLAMHRLAKEVRIKFWSKMRATVGSSVAKGRVPMAFTAVWQCSSS
jgi:hypothetical protein